MGLRRAEDHCRSLARPDEPHQRRCLIQAADKAARPIGRRQLNQPQMPPLDNRFLQVLN